jgi:hypothetical protein
MFSPRKHFWCVCGLAALWVGLGSAGPLPAAEELGKLSEKYESGGRGPATVSSGVGDRGGISYGTYQLSSKLGRADAFVQKYFPEDFRGLKAGTPAFTARWKEVVQRDPQAFRAREHQFIRETHYDPLVRRLEKDLHLKPAQRSRALREVLWSIAVQHGPGTLVVHRALEPLLQKHSLEQLSDETLIRAIYAERSRKGTDGTLVYFRGNSRAVQQAVARRFERELQEALHMLQQEKQRKK